MKKENQMRNKFCTLGVIAFLVVAPLLGQRKFQNPTSVTITTAGTRVQLTSSVSHRYCRSIYIEADDGNTGNIFVGDVTVSSTRYAATLAAEQGFSITVEGEYLDARTIYLDAATNGDIAQWSAICN
jgi:hypothetical protein